MDKKILVQELADALAKNKEISKKDAESFVRGVFEIIEEYLVTDKIVKIKELGTFKLIVVDSRESVNVNTGERIRIASHAKVSFTPDKALADLVNRPFSDFETVILNDGTSVEEMERIDMPVEPLVALPEQPAVEEPQGEETGEVAPTLPTPEEVTVSEEPVSTPDPIVSPVEEAIQEEPVTEPETPESNEEVVEQVADSVEEIVVENAAAEQKQKVVTQHVGELNVATQHVEHQTIQQINRPEDEEDRGGVRISWGGVAAFALLTILLMIGSFYAGYSMRPTYEFAESDSLTTSEVRVPAKVEPKIKKPQPKVVAKGKSTAQPTKAKPQPKKPNYAELAKKYEQIEGGEYWIVGTKETHEMVVGDNLYKIAKATYGDKELARYIIKHNNIENPDVIHLGAMLKLPELVKKD